jgi:hypothetical protein
MPRGGEPEWPKRVPVGTPLEAFPVQIPTRYLRLEGGCNIAAKHAVDRCVRSVRLAVGAVPLK